MDELSQRNTASVLSNLLERALRNLEVLNDTTVRHKHTFPQRGTITGSLEGDLGVVESSLLLANRLPFFPKDQYDKLQSRYDNVVEAVKNEVAYQQGLQKAG